MGTGLVCFGNCYWGKDAKYFFQITWFWIKFWMWFWHHCKELNGIRQERFGNWECKWLGIRLDRTKQLWIRLVLIFKYYWNRFVKNLEIILKTISKTTLLACGGEWANESEILIQNTTQAENSWDIQRTEHKHIFSSLYLTCSESF